MGSATMRVAIIGAGAAGLVTARELRREGIDPVVFERRARPGGVWIYDPPPDPERPSAAAAPSASPMYASLRTNLPRDLMAFHDVPFCADAGGGDPRRFPGHAEVLAYLERFTDAFGLDAFIRPRATVRAVEPRDRHDRPWPLDGPEEPAGWSVRWLEGSREHRESFDAVAVCNGHYHEPRIPDLPGLEDFAGRWIHSRTYRTPHPFADQTVAVLGARSSGLDLSHELATVARRVIRCARDQPRADAQGPRRNLDLRPSIVGIEPTGIRLHDGSCERPVDALVLCTGYRYAFAFFDATAGLLDDEDDRVAPLYLDLWSAHAPTLAFIGLPQQVVPFGLFEHQARVWARALAGRVSIPDRASRRAAARILDARLAAAGVPPHHRLHYGPAQFAYVEQLAALAGDPPPPEWRARLYPLVGEARRRDPYGYRDAPLPSAADLGG